VHVILERIERDQNCYRFFCLGLEPDLFGEWLLLVHWGRIGTSGRWQVRCSGSSAEMEARLARIVTGKLRRGYRPVVVSMPGRWICAPPGPAMRDVDRLFQGLAPAKSGLLC